MKNRCLMLLFLLLAVLLAGCSKEENPQKPLPTPTPAAVEAPDVVAQGQLADAARSLLSPFESYLSQVAQQSKNNLSYTIPSDLFAKMASDAQEMNVSPVNGFYQFTWRQSGQHSYLATGLEVQEELNSLATEAPEILIADDAPMDDQRMGDFVATGGGLYDRSYAYQVQDDLSFGTAEITNTLNGEITGHEIFSFCVKNDQLYFVYAARELTATLDILESNGEYLVTAGVLGKNSVETVDYLASGKEQIPSADALDINALLSSVSPLARLSAQGNQITVMD